MRFSQCSKKNMHFISTTTYSSYVNINPSNVNNTFILIAWFVDYNTLTELFDNPSGKPTLMKSGRRLMHYTNHSKHHSNALATTHNPALLTGQADIFFFSKLCNVHSYSQETDSYICTITIKMFFKLTIKRLRACVRISRAMRKLFS